MFDGREPLDFWSWGDDRAMVTGFMDLACMLELAVLNGESPELWPAGYRKLMLLFNWEASAQSDGWSQYFEATDELVEAVCTLFRFIGLPEEADAIRRARSAADEGGDVEELSAAYNAVRHEMSVDLDRLEYMARWFRDNAGFYLYREPQ